MTRGSQIETLAILWYAQAWRIRPLQIHNNFFESLGYSKQTWHLLIRFKRSLLSQKVSSTCRFQYSMHKLGNLITLQTNLISNCWDSSTFPKKHQIPSRSLEECFSGNPVKSPDCRAFSLFKTLPGCRAFIHSRFNLCTRL